MFILYIGCNFFIKMSASNNDQLAAALARAQSEILKTQIADTIQQNQMLQKELDTRLEKYNVDDQLAGRQIDLQNITRHLLFYTTWIYMILLAICSLLMVYWIFVTKKIPMFSPLTFVFLVMIPIPFVLK